MRLLRNGKSESAKKIAASASPISSIYTGTVGTGLSFSNGLAENPAAYWGML